MTTDDRLKLAMEAAERGDHDRCRELLAPVEREINRILTTLNQTVVAMVTSSRQ
jgi:phage gp29-like protein